MNFTIKQNDTAPILKAALTLSDNPVDLTDCTIALRLRDPDNQLLLKVAEIFGDPTAGVVSYSWNDGDLVLPGRYLAEFVVTYPGGRIMTFPSESYFSFTVNSILSAA